MDKPVMRPFYFIAQHFRKIPSLQQTLFEIHIPLIYINGFSNT